MLDTSALPSRPGSAVAVDWNSTANRDKNEILRYQEPALLVSALSDALMPLPMEHLLCA